eukprot:364328-Chlamydomonas_euryale.AAC.7
MLPMPMLAAAYQPCPGACMGALWLLLSAGEAGRQEEGSRAAEAHRGVPEGVGPSQRGRGGSVGGDRLRKTHTCPPSHPCSQRRAHHLNVLRRRACTQAGG